MVITLKMAVTFAAMLTAAAVHLAAAGRAWAQETDSVFFHEHYQDALREAKRTGKPMFLAFRCEP